MEPKYPSKYKPEYCDMLIKHMSEGKCFRSFGGVVSVSRASLYRWVDDHPDFKEAKEIGYCKSLLDYEEKALAFIKGEQPENADRTVLIFRGKTVFHEDYGEKKEVKHDVSDPMAKIIGDSFKED